MCEGWLMIQLVPWWPCSLPPATCYSNCDEGSADRNKNWGAGWHLISLLLAAKPLDRIRCHCLKNIYSPGQICHLRLCIFVKDYPRKSTIWVFLLALFWSYFDSGRNISLLHFSYVKSQF